MGSLTRFNLNHLRTQFSLERLVETGTGRGGSLDWALRSGFTHIESVEQSAALHEYCCKRFERHHDVHLHLGSSVDLLRQMASQDAHPPTLYFLDAHFFGGADFGLTTYAESARDPKSFPLLEELDVMLAADLSSSVIIVDDMRMYFDGEFQTGVCPEFARRWHEKPEVMKRVASLEKTHTAYVLRDDEGYLVIAPKSITLDRATWCCIRPHDKSGPLQFTPGVPGVTAISMQRRLADSRFATRYFKGNGLDVGGGIDSLAMYQEFFPLVKNVFVFDRPHGDAQMLSSIVDESFDFLYSSHCLEHLRDPHEALANWLRVVKPGGHLVVSIPDEDMYEHGVWPSRFNTDHKLTFTMGKEQSWSPVSVNVLPLMAGLVKQAELISLQQMDHGFRTATLPKTIDQTRTPMAECSIEFVLRKR